MSDPSNEPNNWTPTLVDVDRRLISVPECLDLHTHVRGIVIGEIVHVGEERTELRFYGPANGVIEHRSERPTALAIVLSGYPTVQVLRSVRSRVEAWCENSEHLVMCCAPNKYGALIDIDGRCVAFTHRVAPTSPAVEFPQFGP